jgi:hypothetical protein
LVVVVVVVVVVAVAVVMVVLRLLKGNCDPMSGNIFCRNRELYATEQ